MPNNKNILREEAIDKRIKELQGYLANYEAYEMEIARLKRIIELYEQKEKIDKIHMKYLMRTQFIPVPMPYFWKFW